jgi:hypothetical protein
VFIFIVVFVGFSPLLSSTFSNFRQVLVTDEVLAVDYIMDDTNPRLVGIRMILIKQKHAYIPCIYIA